MASTATACKEWAGSGVSPWPTLARTCSLCRQILCPGWNFLACMWWAAGDEPHTHPPVILYCCCRCHCRLCLQACLGFAGLLVVTIYVLATDTPAHALPSTGFALDLGDGLVARSPGYAGPINCTDPVTGARTCDNYAYPAGDFAVNAKGMTDVDAYAPFPNAILMNCE